MTKPLTHPENSMKGSLIRPTYSPGLLLEDDDLTAGVSYTRGLTQLLFRSLFGCGVICGYKLSPKFICNGRKLAVEVSAGVGLDGMGNPLELRRAITLEYDPDCADWPKTLWVTACYTEIPCRPRELACGDDNDGHPSFTRLIGGVRIDLHPARPDCACSCEPPEKPTSGGKKGCCEDDGANVRVAAIATVEGQKRKPKPAGQVGDTAAKVEPAEESQVEIVALNTLNGCYDGHMNGDCGCGCGCACILIGKLELSFEENTPNFVTDYSYVRQIRPWLIGQELNRRKT
jgi:hypothetical protein